MYPNVIIKAEDKNVFSKMHWSIFHRLGQKLVSDRGIGTHCLKSHFPIFYEMGKGVKY